MKKLEQNIFNIQHADHFNSVCLDVFNFQYENNIIYKRYINELNIDISKINSYHKIPFLPIQFFKSQIVISGKFRPEITFKSSGTTGISRSSHHIKSINLYKKNCVDIFNKFYGNPKDYVFLGLLPSYSERNDSSLIYMVNTFMNLSKNKDNGFYLTDFKKLFYKLQDLEKKGKKTVLFGVSFALIDFLEQFSLDLKYTTIIETGGMKGRKKEITREELHDIIKKSTNSETVHSEYGMTELLSQAYSVNGKTYKTVDRMKILVRDTNDPFSYLGKGKTGGINVIDLVNLYSCSFIETQDLGKLISDDEFQVSGRFDQSDIRGCNLMVI